MRELKGVKKMKNISNLILLIVITSITGISYAQNKDNEFTKNAYPKAVQRNSPDIYFGTTLNDPYRGLENLSDPETIKWIAEENNFTNSYLGKIPYYSKIKNRLVKFWNYPKTLGSFKEGEYTFLYKNTGLQNQNVLYRKSGNNEPEVFLDPNEWSVDGTTSLSEVDYTKDGSMGAYQIAEKGSDWHKLLILRTVDKSVVDDTLYNIRFSNIVWKGNEGFFYVAYDIPSLWWGPIHNSRVLFHKIGTEQKDDSLIFNDSKNQDNMISIKETKDGRYLVITDAISLGGNNKLYIQDMLSRDSKIIALADNFESKNQIIDNDSSRFFIITNLNAPNYKLITADVLNSASTNWKDLIPETKNTLTGVSFGGNKLFGNYLENATSLVIQYNNSGEFEHVIDLPGMGTAAGFGGSGSDKEVYYTFTSYIYPPTVFKYDIAAGKSEIFKKADELRFFDPEKYEAKKMFYTSKDGMKIPMIINFKKGTKLDGKNPTLLYGYGGFGVSLTPAFNVSNVILLERGGIFAVVNIRGGGEYGEKWHNAATKMNRQRGFDDFIAAAEYLINNKYTSKDYLALHGVSNGGLLNGAVLTQRPDLFKVALIDVGALDMIYYNKVGAGPIFVNEFGTVEDSKEMFDYISKYSPYHALKPGTEYPAVLIMGADHDETLGPFTSSKFAARLQQCQAGNAPVLFKIEHNIGHGYGKSTTMTIEELADQWAFLFYNIGIKWK